MTRHALPCRKRVTGDSVPTGNRVPPVSTPSRSAPRPPPPARRIATVTLTESSPIGTPSDTVTPWETWLPTNRQGFCGTRPDGRLLLYFPDWIRVRVTREPDGWIARPLDFDAETSWLVQRQICPCGAVYPVTRHFGWSSHCYHCTRRRRTDRQRERRRAARALTPQTCQQCGAPVVAQRRTRRYCSGRCRMAASRTRRHSRPGGGLTQWGVAAERPTRSAETVAALPGCE